MKTTTIISIICISALLFGSCRARTSTENQAETTIESDTLYIQQEIVQEKIQELKQEEINQDTISQIIPPSLPEFEPLPFVPPGSYSVRNIDGLWYFFDRVRGRNYATYIKFSGQRGFMCGQCFSSGESWGIEARGLFVNGLMHGQWRIINCATRTRHEVNFRNGLVIGHYRVTSVRNSVIFETYFENPTMIHEIRQLYDLFRYEIYRYTR